MSTLSRVQQWLADALGVQDDLKPPRITAETSLTLAAVWYSVNKIAGDIASLPLAPYERDGRNRNEARDHSAFRLVKYESNPIQTADVFKQVMQAHVLLWGNGRAYIRRTGLRQPVELIVLPPDAQTELIKGEKFHTCRIGKDHQLQSVASELQIDGEVVTIPDADVLHVMGLSLDGISGLSVVGAARRSLSIGGAADARAARQMRKGFTGKAMLQTPPGALKNPVEAKEFLDDFRKQFAADEDGHIAGLLRDGATLETLNMSNDDMQFLESRAFQRQEVMQWFGLESMPGDRDSVSYNSLTQKQQAYLQGPLSYWCERWEMACNKSLLRDEQKRQSSHYFHFNMSARLRGTPQERYEVYQLGRQMGVLSANEIRELEDMNPIEGGDTYENPNITPGDPGSRQSGDSDSEESSGTDESPANRVESRATLLMLENLIKVEKQRAEKAASSRNFLAWMDKFYPKWETKLADTLEDLGGDRDLATAHCAESRRQLLEVSGNAQPDTLADSIRECVSGWDARAQNILHEMELAHV
jgi:HK97 family phage portal protein